MTRRRQRSPDAAMLREILEVLREQPGYARAARRIGAIERRYLAAVTDAGDQLPLRHAAARMVFLAAVDGGRHSVPSQAASAGCAGWGSATCPRSWRPTSSSPMLAAGSVGR